jgi:predicted ATPase
MDRFVVISGRSGGSKSTLLAAFPGVPIVLETEENGAVSASVPGLPVYAAADSHAKA